MTNFMDAGHPLVIQAMKLPRPEFFHPDHASLNSSQARRANYRTKRLWGKLPQTQLSPGGSITTELREHNTFIEIAPTDNENTMAGYTSLAPAINFVKAKLAEFGVGIPIIQDRTHIILWTVRHYCQ